MAPSPPAAEHLVELEAVVYGQLGLTNRKLGLLEMAESAFSKAADLGTRIRQRQYTSSGWLGRLWCLRAYTSAYRGQYQRALTQLAVGVSHDESLGIRDNRALQKAWRGSFSIALGRLREAIADLEEAVASARDPSHPDQRQLCHALIRHGDAHMRLIEIGEGLEVQATAERSYADGLAIARTPGRRQVDLEVDALRGMSELRLAVMERTDASKEAIADLVTDVSKFISQAREVGNRYVEYELRVLAMRIGFAIQDGGLVHRYRLDAGSHEFAVLQAWSDLVMVRWRQREGDNTGARRALEAARGQLVDVDHVGVLAMLERVETELGSA